MFRLFFSCMTRRNVAPKDAEYCVRMVAAGMYVGSSSRHVFGVFALA
jgi:hypothetical protein